MRGDLDVVKGLLLERMREVCERLLPDGKEESGQWVSFNPVTADRGKGRLPALKVRLRNGTVGAWKDWRSGEGSDALGLVAYIITGNAKDATAALKWARDFLGLQRMSQAERSEMRRVAVKRREAREKDDERRRQRKLQDAAKLFAIEAGGEVGPARVPLGTFKCGAMSPAELHARAYLRDRKVDLDQVTGLNRLSFRFSPQTEWWKGATWSNEDGRKWKSEPGPLFPAVHSAMRNAMGIVTACHVTFLDPVLPRKAPVDKPKLMYGEALGAVIEISTGHSAYPFWNSNAGVEPRQPLIIAEGIETAASFAVAVPEARVWAAGSLVGIAGAPVHLDCIDWILFARDNNSGNPQAQKAFATALDALEASGKRVVVEASHVGDDFNDLAKGNEE